MFSVNKLPINRASRELRNTLKRQISKTSSAPNSDAVSRKDGQLRANTDLKPSSNVRAASDKWTIHSKHNNSRALSTIQKKVLPNVSYAPFASKEEIREFMAIFPDIVRDLTDAGRYTDLPEVMKRFAHVLQYNVPNGKKSRGLTTVMTYKMLEKPENLTPENIRLANILGWCSEMIQSYFIVTDDILDNSISRRGRSCWYRNEGVGLIAINDGILLENSLYLVLKEHFSSLPCYVKIMELFHEITFHTALGQSLDCLFLANGKPDLDLYTMKNFKTMAKYKTKYYSFQLPISLGMYLANMTDAEQHRQVKTILLEMAEFYQVQNDFLDVFGDPKMTGKIGTDISDGKCSWLAVVALQRATPAQRKIMEEHYGNKSDESVAIVKNLYEEMGLPATYSLYEEESFNMTRTHIQQISKGLPHELFLKILRKLYKQSY